MKQRNRKACRNWITVACVFFLTGCVSVISRGALNEVDETLTFETLVKDPATYRGQTVLLGGEIIETETLKKQTIVVVLQRPLGHRNKPVSGDLSYGRFLVIVRDFLDPAIYRKGRKITVVGKVVGKRVRPLGEKMYAYPLLAKRELYIWPLESHYYVPWPLIHFGFGVGVGIGL